jgi:hypothetical protein
LRKAADIATVISGDTKEMAVASTMGSRASAIAEHAADADQATPDLPKRAYRTHGRRQLVPPRIDHQYRKDRKSGAEEHDLPHRIGLTEKTHQCRHHREQQRRQHLERNRLDDIHACVAPLRRAAAASSVGTGMTMSRSSTEVAPANPPATRDACASSASIALPNADLLR